MDFFYTKRFEYENNKKYLVLRPIPSRIIFNLLLLLIMVSTVYLKNFYMQYLGKNFLNFAFGVMGLFIIGLILQSIEQFKVTIARFKKKELIVKGGTTAFNFKNPPETWIQQ